MPRDLLRRYPLFALLGAGQLDAWLAAGQELTFATGETVFQQGTAGVWAYLVLEGRVRILRRASANRELSFGTAGPGEVLGDYALVPPHRNTATCRAADPTTLFRLPLLPLRDALAAHPEIQRNLKRWLRLHALLKYLRGGAFLGFMSAPKVLQYLDRLQAESFRALRTIQADGLAEDRWYFIEQGAVALHAAHEPRRELGPGDCFGERALADWKNLPVVVAQVETRCLSLPRSVFAPHEVAGDSIDQTLDARGGCSTTHPWVGQREETDCGVAALAMMARHHGREVPVEQLRRHVRPNGKGMSLLELQRLAGAVGLAGQAVRADPDHLRDVTLPAIAHMTDGHYVVVFQRDPCRLVIGDPATGIVTLSEREFREHWSGCLVLLSVEGAKPVERRGRASGCVG